MAVTSDKPLQVDRKARMQIPFQDLNLRPASVRVRDFDDVVT